jgi:hypothetical protein
VVVSREPIARAWRDDPAASISLTTAFSLSLNDSMGATAQRGLDCTRYIVEGIYGRERVHTSIRRSWPVKQSERGELLVVVTIYTSGRARTATSLWAYGKMHSLKLVSHSQVQRSQHMIEQFSSKHLSYWSGYGILTYLGSLKLQRDKMKQYQKRVCVAIRSSSESRLIRWVPLRYR